MKLKILKVEIIQLNGITMTDVTGVKYFPVTSPR